MHTFFWAGCSKGPINDPSNLVGIFLLASEHPHSRFLSEAKTPQVFYVACGRASCHIHAKQMTFKSSIYLYLFLERHTAQTKPQGQWETPRHWTSHCFLKTQRGHKVSPSMVIALPTEKPKGKPAHHHHIEIIDIRNLSSGFEGIACFEGKETNSHCQLFGCLEGSLDPTSFQTNTTSPERRFSPMWRSIWS